MKHRHEAWTECYMTTLKLLLLLLAAGDIVQHTSNDESRLCGASIAASVARHKGIHSSSISQHHASYDSIKPAAVANNQLLLCRACASKMCRATLSLKQAVSKRCATSYSSANKLTCPGRGRVVHYAIVTGDLLQQERADAMLE
eukprot:4420-Heterococcus_DN1.PRE.3